MCRGLSVAVRSLLMASRRDVYVGTYIVCQEHEILPMSQVSWSPRCRSYLQSSTPLHDAWRGPHTVALVLFVLMPPLLSMPVAALRRPSNRSRMSKIDAPSGCVRGSGSFPLGCCFDGGGPAFCSSVGAPTLGRQHTALAFLWRCGR